MGFRWMGAGDGLNSEVYSMKFTVVFFKIRQPWLVADWWPLGEARMVSLAEGCPNIWVETSDW